MFKFGIVEDINDPNQLGRVRVRVYGIHSHDLTLIPTDALPWATVMQPTTSAANSGVGQSPRIINGSMVMVTFLDEAMQHPIVMGTIPSEIKENILDINGTKIKRGTNGYGFQDPEGNFPRSYYLNDLPLLSRDSDFEFPREQHKSTNNLFGLTEPEDIRGKHRYPYNQVRQSVQGHHEEWDDTPGNERLNRQHKSGSFEEIRPDGTIVRKIVGDNWSISAKDNNVYVEGNVNLHINTDCNTYIKGDWNVQVDGNHKLYVKGNIDRDADGHITEDATTINLNSGSMGAARIGDTTDTGDAGTGSHFDSNSAGSDIIETGSGTVFIGD